MCVICNKPAGVKTPSVDTVKAMCKTNPDGFGMVTFENGQIVIKKTMNVDEYIKWTQAIPDDVPAIMHMRIATHGSVGVKNCHPFISDDKQWAFAHNGILSIHNEGDMTDSETFFRRIALPILNSGMPIESNEFAAMIECIIGSSKFVFMDNQGKLNMFGPWQEKDGLFYSNLNHERVSIWDDYDSWWKSYETKDKNNKKSKKKQSAMDSLIKKSEYDELVETLADGMANDQDFWYYDEADLYDEYKESFEHLSYEDFMQAYADAYDMYACTEYDIEEQQPELLGEVI